jgi:hypothetical protein
LLRLLAWLALYRSIGWFTPSAKGALLPMPASWQGWVAFGVLVVVLAICATMGPRGVPIGTVIFLLYGGLAYWTLEKAD